MAEPSLIIEANRDVLVDTQTPSHREHKIMLSYFADLIKCPHYIHTYHITQTSLWNGFHAGWHAKKILSFLSKHAKYPLPKKVIHFVEENHKNYHLIQLVPSKKGYYEVTSKDSHMLRRLLADKVISKYMTCQAKRYYIPEEMRGTFKADMIRKQIPVWDLIGFMDGESLRVRFNAKRYAYRDYQWEAIQIFLGHPKKLSKEAAGSGGAGVIVLPCGSGKTMVGIGVICQLQMSVLIITPNTVALRQWIKELLDKTNLQAEQVGEYSGDKKEIKPITVSTYQILTYRSKQKNVFKHYPLFHKRPWGFDHLR